MHTHQNQLYICTLRKCGPLNGVSVYEESCAQGSRWHQQDFLNEFDGMLKESVRATRIVRDTVDKNSIGGQKIQISD